MLFAWTSLPPAFIGSLGPMEMLFVVALALIVFGKDLPNVAREWGKAFNEFRRHLNNVRDELNDVIYAEPERPRLEYHPQFQSRDPLPQSAPDAAAIEPAAADQPADGAPVDASAER